MLRLRCLGGHLLDVLPFSLMVWHRDGHCLFVNRGALRALALPRGRIKASFSKNAQSWKAFLMALVDKQPFSSHIHLEVGSRQDTFFLRLWPVTRKLRLVLLTRDVRFLQHLDTFRRLMDHVPVPVLLGRTNGVAMHANTAFAHWVEGEDAECVNRCLNQVRLPNSLPSVIEFTGVEGRLKQGTVTGTWLLDEANQLFAFFVLPLSMSTRVNSKEKTADLLDGVALPALVVNSYGVVMRANRFFHALVHEKRVMGKLLTQWLVPESAAEMLSLLKRRRFSTATTPVCDVRLRVGPEQVVRVHGHVIEGRLEKAEDCVLLVLSDVTEMKRREDQMRTAQRLQTLGQLSSGISHDFNNLLTSMLGFCDLLLQRHGPQDRSFTDIMQIKQNANRAANLIRQLLHFAKETPETQTMMNLKDCLNEMSFVLRRLLGPSVELKMDHSRAVRTIKADQPKIEQIVMNLAVNARDAMPKGGMLTFRTRPFEVEETLPLRFSALTSGPYVLLEVIDTGSGISEKMCHKIFEPFFSTKDADHGTGLGLATVRDIVEKLGGGIDVTSQPGEGTTFSLYLPRGHADECVAPLKAPYTPAVHPVTLTNARVLIVEDEDPVRLFAARALRSKGYEVLEAREGHQGLDVLKKTPGIQLLITDVMMAGMDGPSLALAACKLYPYLQVLFVSGYPESDIRLPEDLPKAIVHFLPKPFNLDSLVLKVGEILGGQKKRA